MGSGDKKFVTRQLEAFGANREDEASQKDRQHTGRAFTLRFRFKDGRQPVGIAWAMFNDFEMQEWPMKSGAICERLVLLFAQRVVFIYGYCLERLMDDIETERTIIIQEMDEPTATRVMAGNDGASAESIKPVVTKIEVLPDLETRINQVLNIGEEDDETGIA